MYTNCKQYRLVVVGFLIAALATRVFADTATERYSLAKGYYSQHRWREAAREFRQLLEKYPQFDNANLARFLLGESLVQTGNYAEAHRSYVQFLRRAPNHQFIPQALFRAGETAYLLGQYEFARRDLKRFHRQFSKHAYNSFALPYLGDLALAANEIGDAQQMYQKALAQFPTSPMIDRCRYGLARTFELQGNDSEAHRFYRFLATNLRSPYAGDALLQQGLLYFRGQQHAEAQKQLARLVNNLPNSPLNIEARYWLGLSQTEEDKWKEAAASLSSAAKKVDANHRLAPAIHFAAAEALRRDNDPDSAIPFYAAVVTRWPKCQWAPDGLQAQVQIAFDRSQHELVEELAGDFEDAFPDSHLLPLVREAVGRSRLQRDEFDGAISVFADLLNEPEAEKSTVDNRRYLLGLAHLGANRHELAIEHLSKIDTSDLPRGFAAGVELARASALAGMDDHARAIEAQQAYLRLQPDGVSAIGVRAQLANSLAKTGNLDEAVKVRDELASIDPRSQFLMPTTKFLADTAFAHERYELSRMLYTKLVEAAPPKLAAEGLSGLAWTLAKLGESVESATTFIRLVDRFPKSSLAAESAVMAARQLQKTGKGIAAAKMYERVASDYADSDYLGEAALAVASFYTTEGADKRKAVELLHRVCTANPQHSQIDAVLYRLAWVLVDLERLDEADNVFQRINRDYRNSRFWADATYRLAERAANADNDDLATKLAGDLIASNVQGDVRCHALYLKGQLAAESERWEDVEQTMQRIVEGFPESSLMVPSEYWLAEAKHRLGKIEEAAPLFKSLEKKTRNIREPWHAIICLRQAQILATKKQWLDAYEVANSIAEQFPGFRQQHEVDYVLGRCLSNRAEFQAAREAYERVVRSPAGSRTETAAMAQWMIGESLLHQKKYDEAIRAYHRVETLYDFPRWQAAALLQAGKCHEAKGELQNAIRLYASLLKEYSDTSFADEASQRLRAARKDTPADS